jgi:hypothetical protein
MSTDAEIMAMILSGFVLCGCYFRAKYMNWRHEKDAQMRNAVLLRELYRRESPPRGNGVVVVVDPQSPV